MLKKILKYSLLALVAMLIFVTLATYHYLRALADADAIQLDEQSRKIIEVSYNSEMNSSMKQNQSLTRYRVCHHLGRTTKIKMIIYSLY